MARLVRRSSKSVGGRARPGIHNHRHSFYARWRPSFLQHAGLWLWIPGSLVSLAPRNDEGASITIRHAVQHRAARLRARILHRHRPLAASAPDHHALADDDRRFVADHDARMLRGEVGARAVGPDDGVAGEDAALAAVAGDVVARSFKSVVALAGLPVHRVPKPVPPGPAPLPRQPEPRGCERPRLFTQPLRLGCSQLRPVLQDVIKLQRKELAALQQLVHDQGEGCADQGPRARRIRCCCEPPWHRT